MSYRPIADYAIIGDTQSAALISSAGSLDWLCLPRFDSPAVFLRLLDDQQGGYCSIEARDAHTRSRHYLEGTNVLQSSVRCAAGVLQTTDFMPVRRLRENRGEGQEVESEHRVVRLLRCPEGIVDCVIALKPTFEYARERARGIKLGEDRIVFMGAHAALHVQLPPGFSIQHDGGVVGAELRLRAGQEFAVVLTWSEPEREPFPLSLKQARKELQHTCDYWRQWSQTCSYQGDHRALVLRSALALKLLVFEPTGAIVAAPTTSLPESLSGTRNWDYRYCWLRDSSLTLVALMNLGYLGEAHDFLHFLKRTLPGSAGECQVLYTVDGGHDVEERKLEHLCGYRGSRPVRIGNAAAGQEQLDLYGELLHCAYLYWQHSGFEHAGESFRRDFWPLVKSCSDFVAARWRDRGNGIWEMRGPKREFTHSKAMCWVALDRALKLARHYEVGGDLRPWERARDEIYTDFQERGFNPAVGAFTEFYGSKSMDASILRLPMMGVVEAGSERMRGSVAAIERQLMKNGLMYRYRQAETNDGLQGEEGTFTACGFWLVENYALQGRWEEAERLFRHLTGYANDVGLLSEEIDPDSGEQLGNFPQGFTHIGLINAAVRLAARQGEETESAAAQRGHAPGPRAA